MYIHSKVEYEHTTCDLHSQIYAFVYTHLCDIHVYKYICILTNIFGLFVMLLGGSPHAYAHTHKHILSHRQKPAPTHTRILAHSLQGYLGVTLSVIYIVIEFVILRIILSVILSVI